MHPAHQVWRLDSEYVGRDQGGGLDLYAFGWLKALLRFAARASVFRSRSACMTSDIDLPPSISQ